MTASKIKLDAFTLTYIKAALWSSTGDDGEPLDDNYTVDDIAPETLERMKADCERFQSENAHLLTDENFLHHFRGDCDMAKYAGHDFWLTRNGHGCGFWDGDWREPAATVLTDAAHAFGEFNLYVGDDGLIYGM